MDLCLPTCFLTNATLLILNEVLARSPLLYRNAIFHSRATLSRCGFVEMTGNGVPWVSR